MTVIDNILYTSIQKIKEDVKGTNESIQNIQDSKIKNYLENINNWKESAQGKGYNVLCYGNGVFVAGGPKNCIEYSTDGYNWTYVNPYIGSTKRFHRISFYEDRFIMIATDYNIYYSTNVAEEIKQGPGISSWMSSRVCYGNGTLVFVNYGEGKIHYSTDFTTVKETQIIDNSLKSKQTSVCFDGNRFIVIYSNINKIYYSSDLITWTEGPKLEVENMLFIYYLNNKYIIVISDKNEYYIKGFLVSDDFINWKTILFNYEIKYSDEDYFEMTYGNGLYILESSSGNDYFLYSTNCINWYSLQLKYNNHGIYWGMCIGNNELIVKPGWEYWDILLHINLSNIHKLSYKDTLFNENENTIKPSLIPISAFYPVNSVYMSINSEFKPGDTFGGTWESIASGIEGVYMWKRTA